MTRTQILRAPPHDADRQDSAHAADARVALKLAAEGYNACRFGANAGGRLLAIALARLRGQALRYYAQIQPRADLQHRLPEDLKALHEHPGVERSAGELEIAAMAYSGTRSGADMCAEFTRAAIGELCAAAVRYTEELLAAAAGGERGARNAAPTGDWRGRRVLRESGDDA
jgi:hypothetical protein